MTLPTSVFVNSFPRNPFFDSFNKHLLKSPVCQVLCWVTLGNQGSRIRPLPVRSFHGEGGTDNGARLLLRLGTREGMRPEGLVLVGETDKQQTIKT